MNVPSEQYSSISSQAVLQALRSLQSAGLLDLPRSSSRAADFVAEIAASSPTTSAPTPLPASPTSSAPGLESEMARSANRNEPAKAAKALAASPPAQRRATETSATKNRGAALAALRQEVRACTRCTELACTRTQTVFGVGNIEPRLCFFGEAPGADEDKLGEPFVGAAGQLLNRILAASGLAREEVYILNVLKCRPPGNRTPEPPEVDNCRPFFERQFEILQPEFICCLGAVAAQALLQTKTSIGKLRKTFHDYRGAKVLATYHPAYLLRNPAAKKDVWEDMQLLIKEMGRELPPREATGQ
jgi:uracil-DNA glycosylase family 4